MVQWYVSSKCEQHQIALAKCPNCNANANVLCEYCNKNSSWTNAKIIAIYNKKEQMTIYFCNKECKNKYDELSENKKCIVS